MNKKSLLIKPVILYFCLSMYIAYAMYQTHFRTETEFTEFFLAIMDFSGRAPDQYRIFPYLLLKGLLYLCSEVQPISTVTALINDAPILRTIFIFNLIASFMMLPLLDTLLCPMREKSRHIILILFALLYPIAHFSGPRPVTQIIIILMALMVLLWRRSQSPVMAGFTNTVLILLMAFTRADVALFTAAFLCWHLKANMLLRGLWLVIPVATQAWLQFIVFPEAAYYVPVISLGYNLTPHVLKYGNHYLLLACLLVFYQQIKPFLLYLWNEQKRFVLLFAGYALTVMIIARLYEYRLYLPFVPLLFHYLSVYPRKKAGS